MTGQEAIGLGALFAVIAAIVINADGGPSYVATILATVGVVLALIGWLRERGR